jgi:hypothetical protein
MDNPVFSPQANRTIGAARVTIGTGGLPTGTVAGGIGFNVSRGATGVYTMAYPAQRDLTVLYSFQAQSGSLGVHGVTLNPRPSGVATGLGSFTTKLPAGTVLDPAPGDVITIFFYASDSDAI